jgi:hypothetical protein
VAEAHGLSHVGVPARVCEKLYPSRARQEAARFHPPGTAASRSRLSGHSKMGSCHG